MYESSGSQFFTTITGIQSRPDTFAKSWLIMTFLTNLAITERLYSSRLVLEAKAGKEIPEPPILELFEKFSVNKFSLSDAKDNTLWPLNRGGIADLPLL